MTPTPLPEEKNMKIINRKIDPFIMILTFPYWLLYWLGTFIMWVTVKCNDYWTMLEKNNIKL